MRVELLRAAQPRTGPGPAVASTRDSWDLLGFSEEAEARRIRAAGLFQIRRIYQLFEDLGNTEGRAGFAVID